MAMNVYQNVQTPFLQPIHGGLKQGQQIIVSATPQGPDERFSINLKLGQQDQDNIALHFNPRFNERQVVRNTRTTSIGWGQEERQGSFPFQKNVRFDLVIAVLPDCYRISVNGQHYCDYKHRLALNNVTHIHVSKGLAIQLIRIDMVPPPPYTAEAQLEPLYNPPMPFRQNIGPLHPGRMVFISGIPQPNCTRFNINFMAEGEYAFTFDVRIAYGGDRNTLVRNTRTNKVWGREEREAPYFPFTTDMYFDMILLVEPDCFKVAVNNKHLLCYNHRVQPLQKIDTLEIAGDVRLCHIRFQ